MLIPWDRNLSGLVLFLLLGEINLQAANIQVSRNRLDEALRLVASDPIWYRSHSMAFVAAKEGAAQTRAPRVRRYPRMDFLYLTRRADLC